jgi:hypothetical protein
VLQSVQVLTDPSNIGSLHTPCSAIGTPLEHGLEAFLELDADRVVETSKFSLGVLDAAGEVRVLSEPAVAEPPVALELSDAVLGTGDPAIKALDGWLAVRDPVPFGPGLGSGG